MKVLVWAQGADTGGQGYRIAQAFDRYAPGWTVWTRSGHENRLGYPQQVTIPLRERAAEVLARYREADVVHLRNNLDGWSRADRGVGKPTLLHHHGSLFRHLHGRLAAEARRIHAVQVAATIDLTLLEPDVAWVPSPYDVDEFARMRRHVSDGRVRIGYFPTSGPIKSLPRVLDAIRNLARTNPEVEFVTNVRAGHAFHMPWPEVLALKAGCDILVDQVILGYGNNAIEAWAMGIPVVAGVTEDDRAGAPPGTRQAMLERWGELPWVDANPDTILETLRTLVNEPELRHLAGERGHAHVRRFHDAPRVVEQLQELYQDAPRTMPQGWMAFTTPRAWQDRRRALAATRYPRLG